MEHLLAKLGWNLPKAKAPYLLQALQAEPRLVPPANLHRAEVARANVLSDAARQWARSRHDVAEVLSEVVLIEAELGELFPEERKQLAAAVDLVREVATTEILLRHEHESRSDPLTGTLNRRALDEALKAAVSVAERSSGEFCVMMIDLDGLKHLNDAHGHARGDEALCGLGRALRSATRAQDSVYRIGGDEFVLLLPFTSKDAAESIAARVSERGAPSFSFGAAGWPADATDASSLLAVADQDLYMRRAAARA
jgi:diguanylate cyclase